MKPLPLAAGLAGRFPGVLPRATEEAHAATLNGTPVILSWICHDAMNQRHGAQHPPAKYQGGGSAPT